MTETTDGADGTTTETTTSETWQSGLPEGFADAPFFKAAESPEAALTAIQNAASHMGQSIRIPGEDAGEDDVKAFYGKVLEKAPNLMPKPTEENMEQVWAAMGRPDKADGYQYTPPEGKEVPPDFEAFAQTAHKHGLSQEQFRGILGEVLGGQWDQLEVMEAQQKDAMEALANEWGLAYDKNITAVKNFLRLTDAPEGIVELIAGGAMSPAEIKWLQSIATSTKSATELVTHDQERQVAMTPVEAQNQIQEMLNNAEHPYWKATDPRHNEAVRKMLELQKFAHPDSSTSVDALRA